MYDNLISQSTDLSLQFNIFFFKFLGLPAVIDSPIVLHIRPMMEQEKTLVW